MSRKVGGQKASSSSSPPPPPSTKILKPVVVTEGYSKSLSNKKENK